MTVAEFYLKRTLYHVPLSPMAPLVNKEFEKDTQFQISHRVLDYRSTKVSD